MVCALGVDVSSAKFVAGGRVFGGIVGKKKRPIFTVTKTGFGGNHCVGHVGDSHIASRLLFKKQSLKSS